jgi:hypothetical protein
LALETKRRCVWLLQSVGKVLLSRIDLLEFTTTDIFRKHMNITTIYN